MAPTWLKKTPKSPHQVLAIINEANLAYMVWKGGVESNKKKYEQALWDANIF